jgi:hypothetical protein
LIIAERGVRINSDAIVLRGALQAKFEAVAPSVGLVIVGQRECRPAGMSGEDHFVAASRLGRQGGMVFRSIGRGALYRGCAFRLIRGESAFQAERIQNRRPANLRGSTSLY